MDIQRLVEHVQSGDVEIEASRVGPALVDELSPKLDSLANDTTQPNAKPNALEAGICKLEFDAATHL